MGGSAEIQGDFPQSLTLTLLPTKTIQHHEAVPKEMCSSECLGRQTDVHQESQDRLAGEQALSPGVRIVKYFELQLWLLTGKA